MNLKNKLAAILQIFILEFVGQTPNSVDVFDDKMFTNNLLKSNKIPIPKTEIITKESSENKYVESKMESQQVTWCIMFISSKSLQRHIHETALHNQNKKRVYERNRNLDSCGSKRKIFKSK